MALVQVVEIATGIVVAEYQVPPTEEIELQPGQRVLFPEVSFGDAQAPDIILDNLDDTDVQVTFTEGDESFTVTIKNLYALLEEGETVELAFADLQSGADFQSGLVISSLDDFLATAAGGGGAGAAAGGPDGDDGLGSDGTIVIDDLFPDHLRAVGVEGVIPTVAFEDPPVVEDIFFEPEVEGEPAPPPQLVVTTVTVVEPDGEGNGNRIPPGTEFQGGGFEDWQPNQNLGDTTESPTKLIITFTPQDSQVPNTITVSNIPDGVIFFVAGSPVSITNGSFSVDASFIDDITLMGSVDSDADIPLTVEVAFDSSDGPGSVSVDAVVVIDAVADKPELGANIDNGDGEGTGTASIVVEPDADVTLNVNATFGDFTDGSETHTVVISGVPSTWALTGGSLISDFSLQSDGTYLATVANGTESLTGTVTFDTDGSSGAFDINIEAIAIETSFSGGELTTDNNTASTDATVSITVDDVPTPGAASVVHDETAGLQDSDETANATLVGLVNTQLSLGGLTAIGQDSTALSLNAGNEGLAGVTFDLTSLNLNGNAASDGTALIVLGTSTSTLIILGTDASNPVLSLHLVDTNSDGIPDSFVVVQYAGMEHDDSPTNFDEGLASTITIDFVVEDGNGSTESATVTVDIQDDGPAVAIAADSGSVAALDETATSSTTATINTGSIVKGDDPDVGGSGAISTATTSGAVVTLTTEAFGADGAATSGSKVFALSVTNATSGLSVTDGSVINLSLVNGVIVGTVSGGAFDGLAAFAISINSTTGVVTVEQYLSLDHSNEATATNSFNSYDEAVALATGSVGVKVTLTDGDGDEVVSNTADISAQITFDDDGPTISGSTGTVTDASETLVLSNSVSNTGTASLGDIAGGADGLASVTLTQAMDTNGNQADPADGNGVFGLKDGTPTRLTSGGDSLEWRDNQDGTWSAVTAAGLVVFTVSVDDATGTYTVTMDGTNPLDGSSEPFNLDFGSNIAGGNSDLFFIFDSGSTTLVNGVPDGSTIMVFSTAEDEQSDTTSVNTSAFSLGVNTGQDIGVGDADGVPQTQGDDTEILTLTFADPKDPTTVFSVNDITAQAINFIKITFNALTDSEFAIVQLFILADVANTDPSAHSIWIRVQGSSLTGNVDEVVTVTQGDESLNATLLGTTVDAGSETNPYLVDSYGAGVTATVFIEGEFETVEFTADVPSDTTYKIAAISGLTGDAGFDTDTTFTATATDGDGDTVDTTFDVAFDAGTTLTGTDGDDVIVGDSSAQTLISGLGDDVMTGGLEADTFQINLHNTGDINTITDFNIAQGDVLDLSALFTANTSTGLVGDFLSLVDNGSDTDVFIDKDGTGAGGFEQVAVLQGVNLQGLESTLVTDGDVIL